MSNQRGVTLVELLVIIAIMGIITAVATSLVGYSLKTERNVSGQNEVQREARLIMEVMTEKMRDGAYWAEQPNEIWQLEKDDQIFMTYDVEHSTIKMGSIGGTILNDSVSQFTVSEHVDDPNEVEVILEISKRNGTIKLESTIIYSRF